MTEYILPTPRTAGVPVAGVGDIFLVPVTILSSKQRAGVGAAPVSGAPDQASNQASNVSFSSATMRKCQCAMCSMCNNLK